MEFGGGIEVKGIEEKIGEALGKVVVDEGGELFVRMAIFRSLESGGDLLEGFVGEEVYFEEDGSVFHVFIDFARDSENGGAGDSAMGEKHVVAPTDDFLSVLPCLKDAVAEGDPSFWGHAFHHQFHGGEGGFGGDDSVA